MGVYKGVKDLTLPGIHRGQDANLFCSAKNGGCFLDVREPDFEGIISLKMAEVAQLRDWLTWVIEKCQWDQAVADGAGRPPKE